MSKLIDLVGKQFGGWTVVSRAPNTQHGGARWNCVCECGTERIITTSALNSGRTLSCGCMNSKEDLTGETYGDLTVISFAGYHNRNPRWECSCSCGNKLVLFESQFKYGTTSNCGAFIHNKHIGERYGRLTVLDSFIHDGKKRKYLCRCDCGSEIYIPIGNLLSGNTKSCGCFSLEETSRRNTTHGHSKERIYNIWNKMISRCENEYETSYPRYGAKGISVCDEWHDFLTFYQWAMDAGYSDELTIDRVDSRGNYCPDNCRWATYKQQARNQSSNIMVEYKGETKTLAEWAEIYSLPYKSVHLRYRKYKWDIERTLMTPMRKR